MVPGRQSSALLVVDESSAGGLCREGRRVPGVNACDRSEWPGYPQTQTPGDPRMQRNPLAANERDFVHERMSADRAVASSEIARELGRYPSTISREVTRNGGRHDYRPSTAGDAAEERRRRPKIPVLAVEGPLRTMVVGLVSKGFSPVATAALCDREPDLTGVCAETIYKGVYDGTLGLKATECLRFRRPRRKKRKETASTKPSTLGPNVVPISERGTAAWSGDI